MTVNPVHGKAIAKCYSTQPLDVYCEFERDELWDQRSVLW